MFTTKTTIMRVQKDGTQKFTDRLTGAVLILDPAAGRAEVIIDGRVSVHTVDTTEDLARLLNHMRAASAELIG